MSKPLRLFWFMIGAIALALGALGVFLPLLPTTPFILLAAFAFARSSERVHDWLLQHRIFGPLIANWRDHGAISRKTKWVSIASMIAIFALSLAMAVRPGILVFQAVVLFCAGLFVVTRPIPRETEQPEENGESDNSGS
ncbi:MAG: YbaN family protein [Pseudomonadota bacterium]